MLSDCGAFHCDKYQFCKLLACLWPSFMYLAYIPHSRKLSREKTFTN